MKKLVLGLILTGLVWSLPPEPDEQSPLMPGQEMAGEGWRPPGPPPEGPGGPGFFHPPGMVPMDPERVLHFLQRNYPERAQELQALKAQKPEQYRRTLAAIGRDLGPLLHLETADPQRFAERLAEFKVDDKVRDLSQAYREAGATQKGAIREQLKPLLEQQFQTRQKREKEHLQHLQEMVQKMESRLSEREGKRAEIIQHHLDELTTDQQLRW